MHKSLLDLLVRTDTEGVGRGGRGGAYGPLGLLLLWFTFAPLWLYGRYVQLKCLSPQRQMTLAGLSGEVPCGICEGCIRIAIQTNRERQARWYGRMKRRNAHV